MGKNCLEEVSIDIKANRSARLNGAYSRSATDERSLRSLARAAVDKRASLISGSFGSNNVYELQLENMEFGSFGL